MNISSLPRYTPMWSWGAPASDGHDQHLIAISAIITCVWALRFAFDRSRALHDACSVFVLFCVFNRSALIGYTMTVVSEWHTQVSLIACSSVLLVSWHAWRTLRKDEFRPQADLTHDGTFLRPCMMPCRTTHSRLLPTKHSFSYSYLYVGIPVGWRGNAGSILSAGSDINKMQTRKTWFSVAPEDYLGRGVHNQGFEGKLRDYLTSQQVSPDKYPYVYLVTAPRFLGFSFNPVSFWYLYDSKRSLAAMILEVNNTFDERRMYFMERRPSSDESQNLEIMFAQEWLKDFHVSPFNNRGGAYSVQSTDPFHPSAQGLHKVDNNIVLKSEDGKPKLVARVFSTDRAIDARNMTTQETFRFVLRWWWVGFMTNPRILKEARTLWAKKLQVYYRPEVLSSGIGRNETPDEAKMEAFFRLFLQKLAFITPIKIYYTAAAGPSRAKKVLITSTLWEAGQRHFSETELRILTPAFYSQLVRYKTLLEAFDRYCLQAADGEAMADCTHPGVLREAITRISASLQSGAGSRVEWNMLANLGEYPVLQPFWQTLLVFLRSDKQLELPIKPSEFDVCVLRSSSQVNIGPYYKIALSLLLADRIAFGWSSILKQEGFCVWALLVFAAASALGGLIEFGSCGSQGSLLILLKLCGVHLWSLLVG